MSESQLPSDIVKMSFEEALAELEQIVRRLEEGRISLDESLALWERGETLHELCRARLDQAESRVAELLERLGRTPPAPPPADD